MRPSPVISRLSLIASYLIASIMVLLPFHALLTTWAGSNFGHLDVFRIWKELLMVPLGLITVWLLYRDQKFFRQLTKSWLIRTIVLYTILYIAVGLWALFGHQATFEAMLYSWIINLRFLWFLVMVWVISRTNPFITQQWLKILLIPAGLVTLLGLLQRFILPADFLRHFGYGADTIPAVQTVDDKLSYQRIQSTLRGANPLGAYLVIIITSIVASLRRKKWLALALAACLVVLFFSYSRSAWIGLVVALAVLGWLQLSSRRGRQVMIISLALAFLLGVGAVWQFQHNDVLQNTVFHSDESSQSAQSSNQARSQALVTAAQGVTEEPLGRGAGTAGPASFRNNHPPRIAENYYLQIGQEAGILGIALFGTILVLVTVQIWHRRRYVLAQVLLATLAGITAINFLSHAWTDDTLSLLWWGLAGAVLSLPAILRTELKHETKKQAKTPQKKPKA